MTLQFFQDYGLFKFPLDILSVNLISTHNIFFSLKIFQILNTFFMPDH